jgi:hypothetical protein
MKKEHERIEGPHSSNRALNSSRMVLSQFHVLHRS